MKIKETWRELHMSAIPVLGWSFGGKYLTMSPAAMVSTFLDSFKKPSEEEERNARLQQAFGSCQAVVCEPYGGEDGELHAHILSPEEVAELINARIRMGMGAEECHDIIREVFEQVEHT